MTARMRRLISDFEQIQKDFTGHHNIIVTPIGAQPVEKYHVTYLVNGIYAQNGTIQMLARHEVEITLHSDYPRYKPMCTILTPIWHPNFRDGQICIGDIWGAGESLSDIIINIGDMIQYKSWNSFSPLCADAAKWAIENKHMFPVGNIELYPADYASAKDSVEIDLFDDDGEVIQDEAPVQDSEATTDADAGESFTEMDINENENENDFEITAEELAGITYTPSAQRMQTLSQANTVQGGKINLKTILFKGIIWALVGSFLAFLVTEFSGISKNSLAAKLCGYSELAEYYEIKEESDELSEYLYKDFRSWCTRNGIDYEDDDAFAEYYADGMSEEIEDGWEEYFDLEDEAVDVLVDICMEEYDGDVDALSDDLEEASDKIIRTSTALWTAFIALFIGLLLGVGEGIYYGSATKALTYGGIGAGVSLVSGYISGYIAQIMYSEMLTDSTGDFAASFVRGIAWAIMGVGIGLAVGIIKPNVKRLAFCSIGGLAGGFVGGFLFNFITDVIPDDTISRAVGIIIMGTLIGLGVGLLEQVAKQAWLKVIRGEFEGKEYLVFAGTTSIGNNGSNTIVLFKDKLVGPHHCDIRLEGTRYTITDCGTPLGTIVNGNRVPQATLRNGDTIAIGNSVLVFNTK